MNLLLPLAALLGLEVSSITERVRNAVLVNALMALFGLIGTVFLLIAGYLALTIRFGSLYAATILAAGFLLLTLAVWLSSRISQSRRRRELDEKRRSSETSAFVTTAALTAMPAVLKSPVLRMLSIPAAALAAYLLMRDNNKTDI